MTPQQVLASHTSLGIARWAAYERFAGPIGNAWRDETLSEIHDMIQNLSRMYGAANFERNPIPDPVSHPRPHQLYGIPEQDDGDDPDAEATE